MMRPHQKKNEMENKTNTGGTLRQGLAESFQRMTDVSLASVRPLMDTMFNSMSNLNKTLFEKGIPAIQLPQFKFRKEDCCAPKTSCPPHCLTSITRHATEGERIIVPFMVKNTCATAKTFRVGVRELKDADGKMAPDQPNLNKSQVVLESGRSERVLMSIDLANFSQGSAYSTEIVLREKEINQNICFTLIVDANSNIPVAEPLAEQKYRLRWQSWQSHFYCEPRVKRQEG